MSAISVAQFKSAVWEFISSQVVSFVPNAQVIWLEQGTPRPKLPYIGLKVISGPRTYGDDDMRQTAPGVYSMEGQRAFTVSLNVFAANAEDVAALIVSSMSKTSAMELLAARSLALLTHTDPQNVSVQLETKFENRIQFDIDFGCVMAVSDEVGFIEQTGIVNNASGEQTEIG